MEEKILTTLIEINQKINEMDNKISEIDNKINEVKKENVQLREEMNNLHQEILVFEDEYGKKIDVIFEFVDFHQKNNLKRFNRISDLETRVENVENNQFDYEKRISTLERKNV